jgi:hypothetical protein
MPQKIKFNKAIFICYVDNCEWSVHWEDGDDEHRYLANIFEGDIYICSYPANCAPNQSNSIGILKQHFKTQKLINKS